MVIASNFPPDASVGTMRTLRLVRHLMDAGWHVDVLTAAAEGFRSGTVVDPALVGKVPAGVDIVRARAWRPVERLVRGFRSKTHSAGNADQAFANQPLSPARTIPMASRRHSRLKRALSACTALPDREVSWFVPAVAGGWRAARRRPPDVIYSSGPPFTAHLVGAAVARLTGRPWVADFRDPWARAPWREDRFAFERRTWAILERWVATRAAAVIFATNANRQDFSRQYGPSVARRFHVVPNGCDVSDFDGLARHPEAPQGPIVLLHAGSLYGARNPAPLFRAVSRMIASGVADMDRFRIRFIGRVGIPGIDLIALARNLSLERVVEFVAHMPRRAVLQEMLDAAALLIVQPLTTVSIPAKLYEYMAAGRPVLALAEAGGETADLVHRSGAGVVVEAEDERAIEQGLMSVLRLGRAFSPVDPGIYDGSVRAAEVRQILADLCEPGVPDAA